MKAARFIALALSASVLGACNTVLPNVNATDVQALNMPREQVLTLTQLVDEIKAAVVQIGAYRIDEGGPAGSSCGFQMNVAPSNITLKDDESLNYRITGTGSGAVAIPIILTPSVSGYISPTRTASAEHSIDVDPSGLVVHTTLGAPPSGSPKFQDQLADAIRQHVEGTLEAYRQTKRESPCLLKTVTDKFAFAFKLEVNGQAGLSANGGIFNVGATAARTDAMTQTVTLTYKYGPGTLMLR
jgi:hypothetical protein